MELRVELSTPLRRLRVPGVIATLEESGAPDELPFTS